MPTHAEGGADAPRLTVDDVIVVEPRRMRQAISGTVVGNFMEWYDFGVYGYLAVTMTAVFTTGMDESVGLLVTLLGFAVSFLVRPLGGLVLGPLGDGLGRQKVLFFTMATMAIGTALIGVLPTSEQIGLWAIIPLYVLKMVQGFSTGGEFAGASAVATTPCSPSAGGSRSSSRSRSYPPSSRRRTPSRATCRPTSRRRSGCRTSRRRS